MKKANHLSIAMGQNRFVLTVWPEGKKKPEEATYLILNQDSAAKLATILNDWLDSSQYTRFHSFDLASKALDD